MVLDITIPENLKELKLKDYIKIVEVLKQVEDEHELVIKIKLASIVTGMSLQDVVKIPANDLNEIFELVTNLLNEKPKFEPIIKVDGKEYGFIPDLENLMTNEYLDLELYYGTDILKTVGILYRPIKNKVQRLYTIEEYKGVKNEDEYLNFPASAYVSCVLFFWTLQNDLLKIIPQFLKENLTEEERLLLEANGDGISQLTKLLEEIELNTII